MVKDGDGEDEVATLHADGHQVFDRQIGNRLHPNSEALWTRRSMARQSLCHLWHAAQKSADRRLNCIGLTVFSHLLA
jgi:hypothetical protein